MHADIERREVVIEGFSVPNDPVAIERREDVREDPGARGWKMCEEREQDERYD